MAMPPTFHTLNATRRPVSLWMQIAGIVTIIALCIVLYVWWPFGNKEAAPMAVQEMAVAWPAWQNRPVNDTQTAPPAVVPPTPRDMTAEELVRLKAENARLADRVAALEKQPVPTPPAQTTHPTPKKGQKMLFVSHESFPTGTPSTSKAPLYPLGAGTWIPCSVEPVMNSDVPGSFTLRTRAPVYDASGQHLLIGQNQSIVGRDGAADLLFGNERIPTWALTLTQANGSSVDLGEFPVTDAAGTNGLTGEVNNHVWRMVWTSLLKGGLQGGQQVVQMEAGNTPAGAMGASMAASLGQSGQQRLGRAQDTRPTIIVASGELCQVLVTKAVQLPALASNR